ncbi:DUF4760 domain-containing protein [Methylicorpusculum oleiharenae]|uniref:DUF4760 domain-containing protein n=1 Tax=Methylicorpusculum oleiharenae TaxID=1338687 RepID=UPI001358A3C0|nr:hypothetical protein [Methylicorpusculum oleiharenae]MCD2452394.1 DUF4760 domain-containing protein [Methylicorpusculum oleiharenae]
MNLHEFSQDVVPIITLVISVIGLFLVVIQIKSAVRAIQQTAESIKLAQIELKQTSAWNKVNSTYDRLRTDHNAEIERKLYSAGEAHNIKFNNKISTDELNIIVSNKELFNTAKEWLNEFESYCAAYRVGALDKELAFQLHGTRISKELSVFRPFINYLRNQFHDDGILFEFESVATDWADRLQKEEKERSDALRNVLDKNRLSENSTL